MDRPDAPRSGELPLEDRLQHFQNLMAHRVSKILLVASSYDSFLLEEDGRLDEVMLSEFMELNLRSIPGMEQVSSGTEALAAVRESDYDLVLSTMHLGDITVEALARGLRKHAERVPLVLLAFDDEELKELERIRTAGLAEGVFVWHGDSRVLLAIVKSLEDRWNAERDVELAGVSVILLIEDSVRFYSAFLPMFYTELMEQSLRVIAEGVNLTHKLMRMRARPKILLCTSFEEAEATYRKYQDSLLGIISDVDFPRGGRSHPRAGIDFARMVRARHQDLPIMLQTRDTASVEGARELGADVLLKDDPHLLRNLRRFMLHNFGFGDFVFRLEDGTEVGRAPDLKRMEAVLREVPDESVRHHASRNHFSAWLRARTEFALAHEVGTRPIGDFKDTDEIREYLAAAIREFRRERQSGAVATFRRDTFDPQVGFAQIGSGSLGGKARGLAYVRDMLYNFKLRNRFEGVRIHVPAAVVLASDVFDEYLETNDLRELAMTGEDREIEKAFLQARFSRTVLSQIYQFLDLADFPLAVRSSSLLEDSQHQPFAGIYATLFVPNNHPQSRVRRRELVRAIKRVYASTFSRRAKDYFRSTTIRLEEEKMAVIVQRLGGEAHGPRFYPHVAGVARSHNVYPTDPLRAEDGVAAVALGLGKTVVDGERAVTFCPRHPERPLDATGARDVIGKAQTTFYALQLDPQEPGVTKTGEMHVARYDLETAREDGTLEWVASVYSPDNDAVYDGISRHGIPFVSMAPVLKQKRFPLGEVLSLLLETGERGMNSPVEIEFAVNLRRPEEGLSEFVFLQMRPFVLGREAEVLQVERFDRSDVLCRSSLVLGHGRLEGIRDLVVVDREGFDPARSRQVAQEVGSVNARLVAEGTPYALIGTGRWGSSEPWLGIPVRWDQIAGTRVIVEADLAGRAVTPSQGSHFFHNLTAGGVGYITVGGEGDGDAFVDWDWLRDQPEEDATDYVRHLRFAEPLTVIMDSRRRQGIILKPGAVPVPGGTG